MSLTEKDKIEIKKIVQDLTKKEFKDFLDTTQAHSIVIKILQKELGTKDINEKIVDLSTKVVVELFKTLWQRKSFWENPLKGVR